jgi:hypothetical protein
MVSGRVSDGAGVGRIAWYTLAGDPWYTLADDHWYIITRLMTPVTRGRVTYVGPASRRTWAVARDTSPEDG